MQTKVYLTLIAATLLTGCASTHLHSQSEDEKLLGTWRLVYQQFDGDKLPNEQASKMFHGRFIFRHRTAEYAVDLPGFHFDYTYRTHNTSRPAVIDFEIQKTGYDDTTANKHKGEKFLGIYVLKGDDLLICWNDQRPTNFSAAKGTGNTLVVLKRVGPKESVDDFGTLPK